MAASVSCQILKKCGIKSSLSLFCRTLCNSSKLRQHQSQTSTHFGYETVPEHEKEQRVHEVFHNVAEKYDVMNDAMSGGIHRVWKDHFIDCLGPTPGTQLLDVAGGTGDIAFRFLDYIKNGGSETYSRNHPQYLKESETNERPTNGQSHVTVCDINQAMLDVGKRRAEKKYVETEMSWIRGNAECLPLPADTFDAYTIAFGIRNCTHIDQVLNEAYRVLKPGGRFMCLEFSQVTNPFFRSLYDQYSFQVIPAMGQIIAGDWKSYQYLVESIRNFPIQEDFAEMIRDSGFRAVTYENLMMGVAAIHSGFKI